MATISANELKTKGISAVKGIIEAENQVMITIRGETKYIIMDVNTYNQFRELELEKAIHDSREDIKQGRIIEESVADHIKRITRD